MITANQNSFHLHKKLMRRKLARCRQNTQYQAWVKNIHNFRPTWSNLCLFFKLKQLEIHSLWGRPYLSSLYRPYMGVPLHRATCQRVLTSINDIEMTLIWLYRRHCGVSRGWSSFILLFTNKKSNRNHYCGRSKTLERSNVLIQTTTNIANDQSKTELVKFFCGTIPYEFDQKKFQTCSVTEQKVQVKFII